MNYPTQADLEKAVAEARYHEMQRAYTNAIPGGLGLAPGKMFASKPATTIQHGMFPDNTNDKAVRVEYLPVENGYIVSIIPTRGNAVAKVYVAKDLAEAHELVTSYMVTERLNK